MKKGISSSLSKLFELKDSSLLSLAWAWVSLSRQIFGDAKDVDGLMFCIGPGEWKQRKFKEMHCYTGFQWLRSYLLWLRKNQASRWLAAMSPRNLANYQRNEPNMLNCCKCFKNGRQKSSSHCASSAHCTCCLCWASGGPRQDTFSTRCASVFNPISFLQFLQRTGVHCHSCP